MIGQRIGPYAVVAKLGEGGMGEVYRARDARLDRDVAIKILPASVAHDPDRRTRFEREAKAVAALSHPNILAIYDIGEHEAERDRDGGRRTVIYAVTELLDGETLRDTVTRGPLPVRKAIDVAIQLARGLAAAHDRGIVHRDLKPENVFLLPDGQVKILDFGLAKDLAHSATSADATAAATDPGTVLGTVGYMAPEQVTGRATDARADLFALGALIYEMLSGRRAFRRDNAAETMSAILRDDPPDLSTSRADLPPALDRIVRHCLEKNPAERFQTARDVAFALEAFSGSNVSTLKDAALPPARRSRVPVLVPALMLLAGISLGAGIMTWLRPAPPRSAVQFEPRTWEPQWQTNSRFAPDGQTIVYSGALVGNVPSVYVLRPGALVPQALGQPGTQLLSISRSGELAVLTGAVHRNHRLFTGTLTRMTMDGAVRPITDGVREADWGTQDSLAVIRDLNDRDRLEYPIGTTLHEVAAGYLSDPRVSPDGNQVAFFEHPVKFDDRGLLRIVDRAGVIRTLAGEFTGAEGIAWSPDGRTIFASVAGPSTGLAYEPVAVDVDRPSTLRRLFPANGLAQVMDVAADGRLLVIMGSNRLTVRALLPGETTEREFPFLSQETPADISRDGRWLLFTDGSGSAGGNYAVGWRKTDGSPPARLGEGAARVLSPDGRWAVAALLSPPPGHMVAYPTGAGQSITLDLAPLIGVTTAVSFFPDNTLLFCGAAPNAASRCYRRPLTGGSAEAVTPEGTLNGLPSPDGHTILATMVDATWQIVDLAGGPPRAVPGDHQRDRAMGWSNDGRAVLSVTLNTIPAELVRIDVATGAKVLLRALMPADASGVMMIGPGRIYDDGRLYSYAYARQTTQVIVVSGVPMR